MSDSDEQIRSLVEEALTSGRTPEEVCGEHPWCLHEVRRRWVRIQSLMIDLDRAFPSSDGGREAARARVTRELPALEGYALESVIGYGGMGVVYKARHLKLDRVVAVKMLRGGEHASPRELAGLLREARAIAALKHPHIVQVFDVDEAHDGSGGGLPYFTMEYVEEGSLAQRLDGRPLPAREAATLVAAIAEAVQAAHAGGIVHRDLKPANVLMGPNWCPKITDFGLARQSREDSRNTLSPAAVGTPSYMAPEQVLGTPEAFGPSVDVYALGAVLYELLAGRPPFGAQSGIETQRQVVAEDPTPPSRLNSKVPKDLEIICLKCLQKDPSRRYATAREVSEDLGRFLRGEPIRARPVGQVERLGKWARRHPGHAVAAVGAVAALISIVGAVLWTVSQRAAFERAASDDIAEAVRLEKVSDWAGARNMLARAKTQLAGAAGHGRLAATAADIERELDLVDRLGDMQFGQRASAELEFNRGKWWGEYRDAFMAAGLWVEGDTPDAFAARVARSPAKIALVTALDDMVACADADADIDWLLSATRLADPDPWRDKARDKALWNKSTSLPALAALAREAPVERQPARLLLNMAGRLLEFHSPEAEALLRRVQAAHPSDFWANFALAESLDERQEADAVGYYRAAIALRPQAGAAHVNLAFALKAQDHTEEALASMRKAAALDPGNFVPHYNLAAWLLPRHEYEEAQEHARIATQINPKHAVAHGMLGTALSRLGRKCEAVESFRRAFELVPGDEKLREILDRTVRECEADSGRPSSTDGR
jgi:serine/threonine-protein kinase